MSSATLDPARHQRRSRRREEAGTVGPALPPRPPPHVGGYLLCVRDYDLAATLNSGQAFRWAPAGGSWKTPPVPAAHARPLNGAGALGSAPARRAQLLDPRRIGDRRSDSWEGVIGTKWVRLTSRENAIEAETVVPTSDWQWLEHYLQINADLAAITASFPPDPPLQTAAETCRGLRLLRQDPWECLASFILSSTKQIAQIRQIIALLCSRYGDPVSVPAGHAPEFAFPGPEQLAVLPERELRDCRMGFRAPYLLETARLVAEGKIDLGQLDLLPLAEAREHLLRLPGVGKKIADCVLLFAHGRHEAFPIDVWVMKAMRELYFPRRRVPPSRIQSFAESHFGPNAGYAQQYLFHYMRVQRKSVP